MDSVVVALWNSKQQSSQLIQQIYTFKSFEIAGIITLL